MPDDLADAVADLTPLVSTLSLRCTCTSLSGVGSARLNSVLRLREAPFVLTRQSILATTCISLEAYSCSGILSQRLHTLAAACADGALPACRELHLSGNDMADDAVVVLAEAMGRGAWQHCTYLGLHKNRIGDAGAVALARIFELGRLSALTVLCLNNNSIGNEGIVALANAAAASGGGAGGGGGALTCLTKFCLSAFYI